MSPNDEPGVDDGGAPQRRKRRRVYSQPHKLDAQKAEWLLAPAGEVAKGAPLRCLICSGTLLLNSSAHLQLHACLRLHAITSFEQPSCLVTTTCTITRRSRVVCSDSNV